MRFLSSLILSLATGLVASTSSAAPTIDPKLAAVLNSPIESERVIAVALVHKNQFQMNMVALPLAAREREMIRNAETAQLGTFRALTAASQNFADRTKIRFSRYWLSNTIIVNAPARVIRTLLNNDQILLARPARVFHLIKPYNHGLVNPRLAKDPYTYGLTKLRIPDVRVQAKDIDGRGVKVGILDTGIDPNHPDLQGKIIAFKDFVGGKPQPYDDHSHGTHVAGTIAGGATSGTAIGVAPGVKLIIGKLFDSNGSATEEGILSSMQWIADPDGNPNTPDAPALVSNSWGGDTPSGDPKDEAECRAVESWLALGILPVFAAGNEGPGPSTVGLPAACPNAFSVGATDEKDAAASFSSRGPVKWSTGTFIKPIVSAPGVRVMSSIPGGGYASYSGTSMATPHTAGVAALVFQQNPQLKADAVANLLINGTIDLGSPGQDNTFGYGRLDAIKALKL